MRSVLHAVWPRVRPSLVVLVVVTLVVALIGAPSVSATNTRSNGYWIALAQGDVNAYGDAPPLGGADVRVVVDMATTPTGHGYWLALSSGEIVSIGDAQVFATPSSRRGPPIVAIGARPQGDGVWLLTSGGELLAYGAALAFAPLDGRSPYSDIAVTPTGAGVWALDKAGDVHVRGDAVAYGNAPSAGVAVAIAPTPSRRRLLGTRIDRCGHRARRRSQPRIGHEWRVRRHGCHAQRPWLLAARQPRSSSRPSGTPFITATSADLASSMNRLSRSPSHHSSTCRRSPSTTPRRSTRTRPRSSPFWRTTTIRRTIH